MLSQPGNFQFRPGQQYRPAVCLFSRAPFGVNSTLLEADDLHDGVRELQYPDWSYLRLIIPPTAQPRQCPILMRYFKSPNMCCVRSGEMHLCGCTSSQSPYLQAHVVCGVGCAAADGILSEAGRSYLIPLSVLSISLFECIVAFERR
jgi:hypothetical protein